MSSLFSWRHIDKPPRHKSGDERVVCRVLLLPRKVAGEWRWLGYERIRQVAYLDFFPGEDKHRFTLRWHDEAWANLPAPPAAEIAKGVAK